MELWFPITDYQNKYALEEDVYINGLAEDCGNFSVLALEFSQSCAKPLTYYGWLLSLLLSWCRIQ